MYQIKASMLSAQQKYSTSPAFVKSQGVTEDTREIQYFRV